MSHYISVAQASSYSYGISTYALTGSKNQFFSPHASQCYRHSESSSVSEKNGHSFAFDAPKIQNALSDNVCNVISDL